ncbi:MAG: efflux RND transporter permease subunit [Planctomycetota bacterium]|jgi:Cu(I)/Ag(I) efflux system membrane protein CusA/SilA
MADEREPSPPAPPGLLDRAIRFSLERKLVVILVLVAVVAWGILVAPFDWKPWGLPNAPVPVDAIPDIGENQQIVFTEWTGRSPRDVEDQITYPLTSALMGMPGVKTVRSFSMLGFSSIYVIFDERVDFYWSRSRILEKLNSLPTGSLPEGVTPTLGPDATALGQVFWYTLEGRDADDPAKPTGGWDLDELRSVQDWQVRFRLMAVPGVAEVASVGGFVKEYQIDVDPDAMRAYGVTLEQVFAAVKASNVDVGARTVEVNSVEYVIRGLGFIKSVEDVEATVVAVRENVPVYVRNVAHVSLGPALRRGALDKGGAEAVGGVVVVRHGANPLEVIELVKRRIAAIAPALPERILPDGTKSRVTVVPFYDRTGLIHETLDTLGDALYGEVLVTIIVVLVMVMHLRSSLLISALLPVAILMSFIAMKRFGIDANIVALSGIAIAIGTMVDMGIVICENILRHLDSADPDESRLEVVHRAAREVGGAVLTAIATTVVGFLPIFTMEAEAGGKLFRPLAWTKTFALVASVVAALFLIPPVAQVLFTKRIRGRMRQQLLYGGTVALGIAVAAGLAWWAGLLIVLVGAYHLLKGLVPERARGYVPWASTAVAVVAVLLLLARHWAPLGAEKGLALNVTFVALVMGGTLGAFAIFHHYYERILRWCLAHKAAFLALPAAIVAAGALVWAGLGREFLPPLDEGSFLYMPTTMPHASIGEALDALQKQDIGIAAIPEVESVVGKIGRAESALDPAPVSMVETVVNYHPEFRRDDEMGRLPAYRHVPGEIDYFRDFDGQPLPAPDGRPYFVRGRFARGPDGNPVPDPAGKPFRQWRPALDPALNPGRDYWAGVQETDDIWDAIVAAADVPGSTSAPKLQPIATRLVMLQTGMRSPMGVKVMGPTVEAVERAGLVIEKALKDVPSIRRPTVSADRIVGKPYLEIAIDRGAIARYGLSVRRVQSVIETAIGGRGITTTVEGRERYPVRVRYLRELRDSPETLGRVLVAAPDGTQVPLVQLARIDYVRGPQVIKSENALPVGYVVFDKKDGLAEVEVVEEARAHLDRLRSEGGLRLPEGVDHEFIGTYRNQVRSERRLMIVLPAALLIIFIILYLQFRSTVNTMIVFSGIVVAWAGGFIMIWLYGQPWFLDFSLLGVNMRELFNIHPINLSTAIWVGFLALFGIASDDGVVVSTYLNQVFGQRRPGTPEEVREATVAACKRRVRPALMTTATTVLALLPVLTSTGRGADIMVPMAIPVFGGMVFEVITLFVVPVLYAAAKEFALGPSAAQAGAGRPR